MTEKLDESCRERDDMDKQLASEQSTRREAEAELSAARQDAQNEQTRLGQEARREAEGLYGKLFERSTAVDELKKELETVRRESQQAKEEADATLKQVTEAFGKQLDTAGRDAAATVDREVASAHAERDGATERLDAEKLARRDAELKLESKRSELARESQQRKADFDRYQEQVVRESIKQRGLLKDANDTADDLQRELLNKQTVLDTTRDILGKVQEAHKASEARLSEAEAAASRGGALRVDIDRFRLELTREQAAHAVTKDSLDRTTNSLNVQAQRHKEAIQQQQDQLNQERIAHGNTGNYFTI